MSLKEECCNVSANDTLNKWGGIKRTDYSKCLHARDSHAVLYKDDGTAYRGSCLVSNCNCKGWISR